MIYTYRCSECGEASEAYRKVKDRRRAPRHQCAKGGRMKLEITGSHHIMPVFSAYRTVGAERGRIIHSRQEHQDYLRQHGYEEVGNDSSMAPPPDNPDEDARRDREVRESLDQLKQAPAMAEN